MVFTNSIQSENLRYRILEMTNYLFHQLLILLFLCLNTVSFGQDSLVKDGNQIVYFVGDYANELIDQPGRIKIEVYNRSQDSLLGSFYSDSSNYLLRVPRQESYTFFVTPEGSSVTHTAVISIPFREQEYLFLKQFMKLHLDKNESEMLLIENRFTREASEEVCEYILRHRPELFEGAP